MYKLGVVVLANDSGLGAQTRRLVYMLNPHRILLVNSYNFSPNKEQHTEWYDAYNGYIVDGFPSTKEYRTFMKGLTHVLVCENPLNLNMLDLANQMGVKVFIQSNYEFCDHLDKDLALPYMFLMPSHWHVDTMQEGFGKDRVMYLPPPIDPGEFASAKNFNYAREATGSRKRFLHIVGTLAANDRNGTLDLLESLKHSTGDFELVIRAQRALPKEYRKDDERVTFEIGNVANQEDLYMGFDALVLPRRYGGLSLTTNEALMSGLPVIMPDISPNNKQLPADWLVSANHAGQFFTRTMIDYYSVDHVKMGWMLDTLASKPLLEAKAEAYQLGYNNYSFKVLRPEYEKLWT